MKIKIPRIIKHILSIMLVLVAVILLFNTNNNPSPLIERILKPINIGSGTLYYSGVFPVIFIYYGLKGMNKFGSYKRLQTRRSRIIVVIIILLCSNGLNIKVVKIVKGMYKDLNAIYYERKYSSNHLEFKEYNYNEEIFNCKITLENCSRETQEFFVKLQVPEFLKDSIVQEELTAKSEDLKSNRKFVLHNKERLQINAVFLAELIEKGNKLNGSSTEFEIELVNDKGETKFTKVWFN